MADQLDAELHYVIRKFDKQIEDLARLGVSDPSIEARREQHYLRLSQSWDVQPEEETILLDEE